MFDACLVTASLVSVGLNNLASLGITVNPSLLRLMRIFRIARLLRLMRLSSGISEALVTTQTGLTIALPGLFLVMMIRRKRQNFEIGLARLESLMLSRHQAS